MTAQQAAHAVLDHHLVAQAGALDAAPNRLAPKVEINQESSGRMVVTRQIAHEHLDNIEPSLDFYTKTLGFKIMTDQPFDGKQRWIELGVNGGDTLVFVSDDVEKTYNELSARGVEFQQPPVKASLGASSVFKDQDGNLFALSSK